MPGSQRIGPVHVLSDFSYRATRCAGEGWVLVGDAFGFLDPMYSSGVFLALKSGEMAADTINEAFERNDFSAVQLSKWGDGLSDGMSVVRKLVGYDRYESREALAALQAVYEHLRLWTNHWQPTLKLIGKERDGARVRKRYDTALTPYRRVLATADLDPAARLRLGAQHDTTGPVALRRRLDAAILALGRLHTRPADPLPEVAG